MAEVVLGIGTSHSPLLTFEGEIWAERGADDMRNPALTLSDGRTMDYDSLLAERGPKFADNAVEAELAAQSERAEAALERLADAIDAAKPDVVIVIGDDQDELYKNGNNPSLAVFYGEEVVMRPLGKLIKEPPNWLQRAVLGYAMDTDHRFPAAPAFALELVDGLMDAGVDLAVHSSVPDPETAAFGHAFGFIVHRLFRGKTIPIVPLLLNTYYPPNVIRPSRCFDIGKLIAQTIEAMPGKQRVAVIASGGLSHFVTDPDLDLAVLEAMKNGDEQVLRHLPMDALRAGSSEILCWVMASGAFATLAHQWSDYVPVFRTPAGTGIGLGFGIWSPSNKAAAG